MRPPLFKLAVYWCPSDVQATLSAYDLTGESKAFVQEINAEFGRLPRTLGPTGMRKAAFVVLRRHGLVGLDAGGWFAGAWFAGA